MELGGQLIIKIDQFGVRIIEVAQKLSIWTLFVLPMLPTTSGGSLF